MPWFDRDESVRERLAMRARPSLRNIWSAVRTMQIHIAGLSTMIASANTTLTRLDARLESVHADIVTLRRAATHQDQAPDE